MNILKRHLLSGMTIAIFSVPATAQDLGQLTNPLGGAASGMPSLPGQGALGAAGSLASLESIQPGSMGNAAGILQYCTRHNYLGSGDATSVKDQLMSKIAASGQSPESNPDYVSGMNGVLNSGSGQTVDLSTVGLTTAVAKHFCGKILDQAKSMF